MKIQRRLIRDRWNVNLTHKLDMMHINEPPHVGKGMHKGEHAHSKTRLDNEILWALAERLGPTHMGWLNI